MSELADFLASEGVAMIAYNWLPTAFPECWTSPQGVKNRTAFNFVNPNSFAALKIQLFSEKLEENPTVEKASEYLKLLKMRSVRNLILTPQQDVTESEKQQQELMSWDVMNNAWSAILEFDKLGVSVLEKKARLLKLHDQVFSCSEDHPEEFPRIDY